MFLAHGYLDSGDRRWVVELMNALLDKDDTGKASVIAVDWSGGATPPYTQVRQFILICFFQCHLPRYQVEFIIIYPNIFLGCLQYSYSWSHHCARIKHGVRRIGIEKFR